MLMHHLPTQSSLVRALCTQGLSQSPHVSCISWHLTVASHGPVCGCWTFRFHHFCGLLSSWPHPPTWCHSAGGRRVWRRCQIGSWGYSWLLFTPGCPPMLLSLQSLREPRSSSLKGRETSSWVAQMVATSGEGPRPPRCRERHCNLQHFSQRHCFSPISLKVQLRHMLGCFSGAQTFRHFSNLIRNHVMVAVPP